MPMYLKLDSVVGEIVDSVVLDSTFVREYALKIMLSDSIT